MTALVNSKLKRNSRKHRSWTTAFSEIIFLPWCFLQTKDLNEIYLNNQNSQILQNDQYFTGWYLSSIYKSLYLPNRKPWNQPNIFKQ